MVVPQPVLVQGVQVLVIFEILPDTPKAHIIVEVIMLLFGINTEVWG